MVGATFFTSSRGSFTVATLPKPRQFQLRQLITLGGLTPWSQPKKELHRCYLAPLPSSSHPTPSSSKLPLSPSKLTSPSPKPRSTPTKAGQLRTGPLSARAGERQEGCVGGADVKILCRRSVAGGVTQPASCGRTIRSACTRLLHRDGWHR